MTPHAFATAVLDWFDEHGRHDLPWQANKDHYHTWISEVMLQQTQVATVIPYFERFIERFPTVQDLADAEQDEVLHLWTGLGYYARARNLHKTAQVIAHQRDGQWPDSVEGLEELPGIGRSTAGAIHSIATNQRAAILDGNVKRVLVRFYAVEGWSGTPAVARELWEFAEQNTPHERCADYTQAMMDMGATLCTRSKPACLLCPLQSGCAAFQQGRTSELPVPRPKKQLPVKQTYMLLIRNKRGEYLLRQRPPTGLWGGLWSLPEVADLRDAEAETGLVINTDDAQVMPPVRHTFSHFHLDITPVRLKAAKELANEVRETSQLLWYAPDDPQSVGLAAPVKRLLEHG